MRLHLPAVLLTTLVIFGLVACQSRFSAEICDRPRIGENCNYVCNRAPLLPSSLVKLPVGSIRPEGWLGRYMELQRDGLTGHLNEISKWLEKENSAWLVDGGDNGWEEMPYWLKGYGDLGYILGDNAMIEETKVWLEGVFSLRKENGYFGPVNIRDGHHDLWANMIMLFCLQSYYEYSSDERVIELMTDYFHWQLTVPEEEFLEDFWENSRAGDNLWSVIWLYNRTGDESLLPLIEKLHRNCADWTGETLPNWHNVNIAQCFREPATYWLYAKDSSLLRASYYDHELIRRTFGQVPGGMFGGDERSRLGYIDPRQGIETCGMVEQMASDELMLAICGDPFWADNAEDVAFNSYPASVMPDFKGLRYITCPNQTVSDSENHYPAIRNKGRMMNMNPFSSRCCQHNHAQGWPYYSEHLVMATTDGGLAAVLYAASQTTARVGEGRTVVLSQESNYPFEEEIKFRLSCEEAVNFPLYLRVPSWAEGASVKVNGRRLAKSGGGNYIRIEGLWEDGDEIVLSLPMKFYARTWQVNKGSVSVNYGPLTLSLKIEEEYKLIDSKENAIQDSGWQEEADAEAWPSYEIHSASPWNYALVVDKNLSLKDLRLVRKPWPEDNFPFSVQNVPLEVHATGRKVPSWTSEVTGLTGLLPDENAPKGEDEPITLVPMGAARLRISSFPKAVK